MRKNLVKRYPRVRRPENRDRIAYQNYTLDGGSGLVSRIGSTNNVPPDARSALTIAAVWEAISIYADFLGMFDFYVAEKVGEGHRQATDHGVHDLVHISPNPRQTAFIYRQTKMVQALSRGNSYTEIERDFLGHPVALWPMCPVATEPILKPTGELVYRTPGAGHPGTYIELPERDVIHIRTMGYDGIKGLSPVECMRRTLGLAVSQETHQASLMENEGVPSGVLKMPGNNKSDPLNLRMRADWGKVHGGVVNAGKIAILAAGMDFVQTQFSPADAELLLSRTFSISDIARMYKIPPHKLGIMDSATMSNIEESNRDFFTTSLAPWITQWEQELTKKLLDRIDRTVYFIKNDVGSLLRGNVAAQTAQDTADKQNGFRSINEVRVSRGETPLNIPAADYHWIETNNLTPIEDPKWGQALPAPVAPIPVADLDPDDSSAQDPTTEDPKLDEVPPLPNPALYEAMRGVVTDPFGRLLHREMQQVRKASKKDEFETWHETYYASQASTVVEAITPALGALSALRGVALNPAEVAERFLSRGRSEVRDLVVSIPPDELPGAVDRLCSQWSEARVSEMVDSLLGVTS